MDLPLSAEQYRAKLHASWETCKHYQKRAEDLFNGHRTESEKEMDSILARNAKAELLKGSTRDHSYERAPDGKFYLVACK